MEILQAVWANIRLVQYLIAEKMNLLFYDDPHVVKIKTLLGA